MTADQFLLQLLRTLRAWRVPTEEVRDQEEQLCASNNRTACLSTQNKLAICTYTGQRNTWPGVHLFLRLVRGFASHTKKSVSHVSRTEVSTLPLRLREEVFLVDATSQNQKLCPEAP